MKGNNTDNRLMEKMMMLHWLMNRRLMLRDRKKRPFSDTSRGQGRIIAILKMQSEISTKDLAYILGIRKQSLNETLGKLEHAGYIERFASEQDRRVIMVRLTEQGKSIDQIPENQEQVSVFSCLNEEEKKQFEEMIDRVIKNISEQSDIDPEELHARMEGASRMMERSRYAHGDERFHRRMDRDFW